MLCFLRNIVWTSPLCSSIRAEGDKWLKKQKKCNSLNLTKKLILIYYTTHLRYGGNAKVVHFLGKTKPWSYTFDTKAKRITGSVHEATTHPTFLLDWWTLYSSTVVPMLQEQYGDQPFHSGCVEVNEHNCFETCSSAFTVQATWYISLFHQIMGRVGDLNPF